MRNIEAHRCEHQDNGLPALQVWLKKTFTKVRVKNENQRNKNELCRLSLHLLDDLGFNREAQPLCWSAYSPNKADSASAERKDKGKIDCQHHCHCDNAVGCLN